ncbi:MAG: hypothetical protein ACFFDP_05345 [Promethearchaeota archaeon]
MYKLLSESVLAQKSNELENQLLKLAETYPKLFFEFYKILSKNPQLVSQVIQELIPFLESICTAMHDFIMKYSPRTFDTLAEIPSSLTERLELIEEIDGEVAEKHFFTSSEKTLTRKTRELSGFVPVLAEGKIPFNEKLAKKLPKYQSYYVERSFASVLHLALLPGNHRDDFLQMRSAINTLLHEMPKFGYLKKIINILRKP